MRTQKKLAFTLIELLVVIAIIGILAGLIILNLRSARVKARDAKRKSDIASVQTAVESYIDDTGKAPFCDDAGGLIFCRTIEPYGPFLEPLQTAGYLTTTPRDPVNTSTGYLNYAYANLGASNPRIYTPDQYYLEAGLEKTTCGTNVYYYPGGGAYLLSITNSQTYRNYLESTYNYQEKPCGD